MFCTGCGTRLPEGAVRCDNCGKVVKSLSSGSRPGSQRAAQMQQPRPEQVQKRPVQKKAVHSGHPSGPPQQAARKQASPQQANNFSQAQGQQPQPPPGQQGQWPMAEPVFSPIEHDAGVRIGSSLSYLFRDKEWLKKSMLPGLAFMFPVLNFFAVGYFIQLARKISNGIELPLPEIEFKDQWMSGLIYSLAFGSMGFIAVAIITGLAFFAQLPIISIFAVLFLAVFVVVFGLYFTGASTLAIIEGNPWYIYRFPECFEVIMENISDVLIVTITLAVLSFFMPLVITAGIVFCSSAHLTGQLARIIRSHSKI